jgi:type IV secretory pathway VirB6-like protein
MGNAVETNPFTRSRSCYQWLNIIRARLKENQPTTAKATNKESADFENHHTISIRSNAQNSQRHTKIEKIIMMILKWILQSYCIISLTYLLFINRKSKKLFQKKSKIEISGMKVAISKLVSTSDWINGSKKHSRHHFIMKVVPRKAKNQWTWKLAFYKQ